MSFSRVVIHCEGKPSVLVFPIFGYCFSLLMDCIRAVLNLQEFISERQASVRTGRSLLKYRMSEWPKVGQAPILLAPKTLLMIETSLFGDY
jgi:hypothetical protein